MTDHDHAEELAKWGACLTCTAEALTQPPIPVPTAQFDGGTYRPDVDHERLAGQIRRVYDAMEDGTWRTLEEIARLTHDPESSVSARLRDLRKAKFGEHRVERRHRGPAADGLYEYLLIPAGRLV